MCSVIAHWKLSQAYQHTAPICPRQHQVRYIIVVKAPILVQIKDLEYSQEQRWLVLRPLDWTATEEKVSEVLCRIVAHADPIQIIAFGSRVRGDHHPDSDLDLAVIVDDTEAENRNLLPYTTLSGIGMCIDMVVVSRQHYDHLRPWLNSVFNYIHREGVVLYDRKHP